MSKLIFSLLSAAVAVLIAAFDAAADNAPAAVVHRAGINANYFSSMDFSALPIVGTTVNAAPTVQVLPSEDFRPLVKVSDSNNALTEQIQNIINTYSNSPGIVYNSIGGCDAQNCTATACYASKALCEASLSSSNSGSTGGSSNNTPEPPPPPAPEEPTYHNNDCENSPGTCTDALSFNDLNNGECWRHAWDSSNNYQKYRECIWIMKGWLKHPCNETDKTRCFQ